MALGGELEADVSGPDLLEAMVDDAVGELGAVALAAEVAEVEVAQVGGHDLLGGISGSFV